MKYSTKPMVVSGSIARISYPILLLTFFLMASVNSRAQSSGTWKTVVDTLQVKISYSIGGCNANDKIFLRIENNSADSLLLTWDDNLVSGASNYSNAGNNGSVQFHIGPNKIIEGSCEKPVTERLLCLPVDLFLRGNYDINNLIYSITGFTKSTL